MTFELVRSMVDLQLICASAPGDFSPMTSDCGFIIMTVAPADLARGNYLMIMRNFE